MLLILLLAIICLEHCFFSSALYENNSLEPIEMPKKDMSVLYIGITLSIIGIGAFLYYFFVDKSI